MQNKQPFYSTSLFLFICCVIVAILAYSIANILVPQDALAISIGVVIIFFVIYLIDFSPNERDSLKKSLLEYNEMIESIEQNRQKQSQSIIDKNYEKLNMLYKISTYKDSLGVIHDNVWKEHAAITISKELDSLGEFSEIEKEKIFKIVYTQMSAKLNEGSDDENKPYIKVIQGKAEYVWALKSAIYILVFRCFQKYSETLYGKYMQMTYKDDYGNVIYDNFIRELEYFYDKVLVKELANSEEFKTLGDTTLEDTAPYLLVGCDEMCIPMIDVSKAKIEDIEEKCKDRITFKCNGNVVEFNKEYLQTLYPLNDISYNVLEETLNTNNGRLQNLNKTISECTLLENDVCYAETLRSLKYLYVTFESIFNKKDIVNLCLSFIQIYVKEKGDGRGVFQKNKETTPYEFEKICADILEEQGFETKVTKKSGDQGVDVIAQKDGKVIAIQCKLYNQPVGNKAVQEVTAGKTYYKADYAVVVSTNTYTTSAKQLAQNCGVYLLNTEELKRLDEIINE